VVVVVVVRVVVMHRASDGYIQGLEGRVVIEQAGGILCELCAAFDHEAW
jgi:hypothetical protein